MTPPDSPSALLERAAAWLTELSTLTTPLPWGSGEELTGTLKVLGADAEWISTMSPAVAQPLVEWLRQAAFAYEMDNCGAQDEHALAFARQVLGEPLDHNWFFPYDSHPGARECSRCGAHDDSQPCP